MSAQLSIAALVDDVWQHFAALADEPFVVRPSLPILFFGDRVQYARSARKIVTVGLNPSGREFPVDAPFRRFVGGAALHEQSSGADRTQRYLAALGSYFRCDPYTTWFRCFEPILNGLDASYYGAHVHTALNTDLCSPLATAPTWSGLTAAQRALLMGQGVGLWHRLIEHLEPDVLLISVARNLLSLIRFELIEPWQPLQTIGQRNNGASRRRPYVVEAATMRLSGGKLTRVVFGQAAHTPFGLITNVDKVRIGAAIGALSADQPDRMNENLSILRSNHNGSYCEL